MSKLVGKPNSITYDRKAGRYRDGSGRFVREAELTRLLDDEVQASTARLTAATRLLIDGKLELGAWERRIATLLRESHLRAAALGSGGRKQMTSRHFGAVGYQLSKQYDWLDRFAHDLYSGKLTTAQALSRVKKYAKSARISYYRAQQISRIEEGFNEAKRSLDPQAAHCQSCLAYSTHGSWVAAHEVTAPGVNCDCGNNCRCIVVYRRRVEVRVVKEPVNLNKGILSQV